MTDLQGRSIDYVRISVTDRCDLRCVYCMPEEGVSCLRHSDLLTYEEIARIVRLMTELGVRAVRVTGGEPLVRRGCLSLIGMLREIPGIGRLSMTTNGILLKGRCAEAKAAGLDDVNISLDTTDPEEFRRLTRLGDVDVVLDAVREALDCGLGVKLNAVPIRGENEDSLVKVAELARDLPLDVRFIELMPIGRGASLRPVPTGEVRRRMEEAFGPLAPDGKEHGLGPAVYGKPEGFTGSIGFISAVSRAFCGSCNRVRVTPEGFLKLCLDRPEGLDLRGLLRGGAADGELLEAMRDAILRKPARHGFGETEGRDSRRMDQIGG